MLRRKIVVFGCLLLGLGACTSDPPTETDVPATASNSQQPVAQEPEIAPIPVLDSVPAQADTTKQLVSVPAPVQDKPILKFNLSNFTDSDLNNWVVFTQNDGFYKVYFPEKPKEQVSMHNSTVGIIESRIHYVKRPTNLNTVYAVSFHDYPGSVVHSDMTERYEEIFQDSRNGLVEKTEGEVVAEVERNYDKYPGRQFIVKVSEETSLVVWAVLYQNRMYGLHVETRPEHVHNPMVQQFLNSFEITYGT